MASVIIQLPFKPISVNQMYRTFRGRVIISEAGRCFKRDVELCLMGMINNLDTSNGLSIVYEIYSRGFWKKDGGISKTGGDIDNFTKSVQDVVFKKLGIDDSFILESRSKKIFGDDKTVITIYEIKAS